MIRLPKEIAKVTLVAGVILFVISALASALLGVIPRHTLIDGYEIDDRNVYADKCLDCWTDTYEIVLGADVTTFRSVGGHYGVDKNKVYYWGSELLGADPLTFVVTDFESSIAEDKNNSYMFGKVTYRKSGVGKN